MAPRYCGSYVDCLDRHKNIRDFYRTEMARALEARGRVISIMFGVRLTPPQVGPLGDTDQATAIGKGLIREAMLMLKNAGEAEGFKVEIDARQIVY